MVSKQATETRQTALVAAALALAAERNPAEVTTAALAQAVGITQGAVFRHFESKQSIWLAVMDQVHHDLLGRLQSAASAHPQPLAALRAVFLAHVDFVVEQPGVPRIIFQELQHPEDSPLKSRVRSLMRAYRALIVDLLQRAQEARQLATGIDLGAAAVLFIGSIQGLVMQSLLSGQVAGMRSQAPALFDLIQQAVVPPPMRASRPQEMLS